MNGDPRKFMAVLEEAGVKCACITFEDGQTMEINCRCRCQQEYSNEPQS